MILIINSLFFFSYFRQFRGKVGTGRTETLSVPSFLFINFMTMMKTKKWTGIQGTLLGGLTFLALMYLPGLIYTKSMVKDQFWWW